MPGVVVSPALTFHEDWFSDWSCDALAKLAGLTADLAGDVVEVGSWEGRSTIALAAAVTPDVVHAVDTWQGSTGEISEQLAAERDVFATFTENTAGLNVEAHRMDWRDYFAERQTPIRFAFIDALHTYDEVKAQIETIRPLLVKGGVICGDDNHHPPIQQAITDTLGDANLLATLWWRRL